MFQARIHAYFVMNNRYHLLLQTPDGNLQHVMRHLKMRAMF